MTPHLSPKTALVALVLAGAVGGATLNDPLCAQRRRRWVEPIPSWGIDMLFRSSIIKDDEVIMLGGRGGRQIDSTLNLGVLATMLTTASAETRTARGFDRVTSLVYAGPSLELRDSLRGPVRFLFRAGIALGALGYERERDGVRDDGTVLLAGVEPELGITIRAARFLQFSATVGVLAAWRLDDGERLVAGPTATTGIRFVR